ncbi:MAG TPA: isoprenylcysteine carboxylmethyltransferase family protein [Burkholderiales bacterium]|nr:isoprenylcysteine carboxylmethyltransferase family protein [Burkholderiales bacterium]
MHALELKIPPPAVAFLAGLAMWAASRPGPSIELPLAVRIAVFVAIALLGGAMALAGDIAFRRARTTINPFRPQNASALVTSGVYRYTRNPMYLGLTLVLAGWAAFLCSAWALLGPVAFVAYIRRFQIAPEERILSGKFGAAYAEYMARVRRWV